VVAAAVAASAAAVAKAAVAATVVAVVAKAAAVATVVVVVAKAAAATAAATDPTSVESTQRHLRVPFALGVCTFTQLFAFAYTKRVGARRAAAVDKSDGNNRRTERIHA
jgi:type IV secretory pathway TrbD component